MSGIVEFFNYVYVIVLTGIDIGEKCLGPGTWHGTKGGIWNVGCEYGVTIGKGGAGWEKAIKTGDWRRDPCIMHCGIWKRIRRMTGKFRVPQKFEIKTPTTAVGVRGTAFRIDVADDGTTLVVVSTGEVEVVDKSYLRSIVVHEGQQITVSPQEPLPQIQKGEKNQLDELIKWNQNVINEKNIEQLEIPEGTIIELPKGRLNYASLGTERRLNYARI